MNDQTTYEPKELVDALKTYSRRADLPATSFLELVPWKNEWEVQIVYLPGRGKSDILGPERKSNLLPLLQQFKDISQAIRCAWNWEILGQRNAAKERGDGGFAMTSASGCTHVIVTSVEGHDYQAVVTRYHMGEDGLPNPLIADVQTIRCSTDHELGRQIAAMRWP